MDIPKDILQAQTTFSWPPEMHLPGYRPVTKPHGKQVREAARLIAEAKSPVLYIGGGVIKAEASPELLELAELTGIPVVTTLMARGAFPDTHQLNCGMPGMHGTVAAVAALQKSDLLITLGARFDDRVTGQLDSFAPDAKVIHADIDPAEIGKNRHADVPIVGDCKEVIVELIEAIRADLATGTTLDYAQWWEYLDGIRRTYPLSYDRPADGMLSPEYVIQMVGKLAGPDAIYCAGVGQHQMWAAQFIDYEKPRTWLNSGGLGTMGYAVPAAMGAKMGVPDAEVWAIDGDGCFQMTNQELATCAVEGVPIKVALINNGNLGMVRQWQTLFYEERYSNTDLSTHTLRIPRLRQAGRGSRLCRHPGRARGGRRGGDPPGAVHRRPSGRHRLHRRSGRPGVADGRRRHQQRRDHGGAGHPSALRRGRGGRGAGRHPRGTRARAAPGTARCRSTRRGSSVSTSHTLSVLVEDKPGVLARVASLFSRRGFNIESLAVGGTEIPEISRMTIVVTVDEFPLEQVTKQLNKLVNVIKIVEQEEDASVARELLLIKVRADASVRTQVIETVNLFRAKVIDVSPESLTIEATGTRSKLDALLRMLEPYGIREIVQSGVVAVGRGPKSITATR